MDIKTNTRVDNLDELFGQGYDAVLVAVGTHEGQKLPIPGADLDGVLVSMDFLRDVNLGKKVKVGEKVLVLGGGDVAFDCARVARRLGAVEVHMACLESKDKMPASRAEIEQGQREDIVFHPSRAFTKIVGEAGQVAGVECPEVESFEFDEEGQARVRVKKGSEQILKADTVIFAVGQRPAIPARFGLTPGRRKTLEVDARTLGVGKEGVFAAGDVQVGTSSVIEAIASGRRAASSIDLYLGGLGIIDEVLAPPEQVPEASPARKLLDQAGGREPDRPRTAPVRRTGRGGLRER